MRDGRCLSCDASPNGCSLHWTLTQSASPEELERMAEAICLARNAYDPEYSWEDDVEAGLGEFYRIQARAALLAHIAAGGCLPPGGNGDLTEALERHDAPDRIELVQELRRTVGLFDGAMAITPKAAWEEAIAEVVRLREIAVSGWCYQCEEKARRADGGWA